jgi:hypothetical protein
MISVTVGFDVNGFAVNSRLSLIEDDFVLSDAFLHTVKKIMMNYDLTVVTIDEFVIEGNGLKNNVHLSYGAKIDDDEILFQVFSDDGKNDVIQACESYEQAVDMVIVQLREVIERADKKPFLRIVK